MHELRFSMAPGLGCLLLAGLLASLLPVIPDPDSVATSDSGVISSLSEENRAGNSAAAGPHNRQNILQVAFFEWTNARYLPSSMGSFRSLTTNGPRK